MQAHGQYDYSYDDYQQSDQYSRQQSTNQQIPSAWQSQETTHPNSNQLNEMQLELEMMKRKRQMIQEQRQLLQEQQQLDRLQRQYENTPRQNYNQYQNYGEGYGRSPGANQRGIKRQAPTKPWRDQPKRFAGNPPPFNKPAYQKPVQKPAYSAPKPAFSTPKPALSTPMGRPKPKFAPKPSTNTMERQAAMDVGPVEPPVNRAASFRQEEVFRGVETASRSVIGKLELLLGRVLSEMREEFFCPPRSIYLNASQTRGLKERLRERIHKMMLGKPIQNTQAMHDMYRKLHTLKGDLRLINTILANPGLSKHISKQEKPAAVAKTEGKPAETDAKQAKKETEPKQTPEGAGLKGKAGRYIKAHIREKLDKKVDEIFAKLYKICMDDAATIPNEPLEPPEGLEIDQQKPEEAKEEVKETPTTEPAPAEAEKTPDVTTDDDGVIEIKDDPPTDAEAKESTDEVKDLDETKEPNPKDNMENYFGFLMDRIIRRKMPSILPRYKNYMMNIISNDKQFAELGLKCHENPVPVKRPPLFFAKVLGRPNLPSRQVMQGFLEQFVCTSVKKHRNIYNLLFVGFTSEELLKKFLESDGTTIGGKKLDIRPSIRDGKPNGINESATDAEHKEEPSKVKLDKAINELDNEIDSLLTSIKGADESTDKGDEAGGGKAETAEEKAEPAEEKPETIEDDESGWGEGEGAWEQEDTAGDNAETPQKQAENDQEETDDVIEVKEDAKSTPIRTRRSSRLPQKN